MLRKFPPRPDDEKHAPDDEERTGEGDGWGKEAMWEGERENALQSERYQQGQAKDHLEDLPPPFVRDVGCHKVLDYPVSTAVIVARRRVPLSS